MLVWVQKGTLTRAVVNVALFVNHAVAAERHAEREWAGIQEAAREGHGVRGSHRYVPLCAIIPSTSLIVTRSYRGWPRRLPSGLKNVC